jgi:hypothetical protein
MPGATRPVQGGAYSSPRSEPGGQNTPRAGRVVASLGVYSSPSGQFSQQVDQGDVFDDYADVASVVIVTGTGNEIYSYDDALSGTLTASGIGTESSSYDDVLSDTITASGIGDEIYSYDESGSGTITASGTGDEIYLSPDAYSDLILNTAGLVAYWRLGEPTGAAVDSTGINHGAIQGTPTRAVSGLIANNANQAIAGDGASGTRVAVPTNASLNLTSAFTIECWIRPDVLSGVVTQIIGRAANTHRLEIQASNRLRFFVRDVNGLDTTVAVPSAALVVGNRYHLVGVYDGAASLARLYVNGLSVNTPSRTPNANVLSGSGSFFLITPAAVGLNGTMDEAALYNVALTAQQVLDHYNMGIGVVLYSDSVSGTITGGGSGNDAFAYVDSGICTAIVAGISSESAVYTDSAIGTSAVNGTGTASRVYDDAGSGTTLLSGTGVESSAIDYIDARSGQINLNGTGVESQSHTSTAIGSVFVEGTSVESQSHESSTIGFVAVEGTSAESQSYTSTAVGSVVAEGTGVESQSHESTAIGFVLASGTASETYNNEISYTDVSVGIATHTGTSVESQSHTSTAIGSVLASGTASETYSTEIPYTDASIGTVTSTGTGVDSADYSSTVAGTVSFLGSGVDSYVGEDASIGVIVLRGIARESSGYAQSIQPGLFSTVVALNPVYVRVWTKTSIQSVVTNTIPFAVQIVLQRNVKADVAERDEMKVLVTNH